MLCSMPYCQRTTISLYIENNNNLIGCVGCVVSCIIYVDFVNPRYPPYQKQKKCIIIFTRQFFVGVENKRIKVYGKVTWGLQWCWNAFLTWMLEFSGLPKRFSITPVAWHMPLNFCTCLRLLNAQSLHFALTVIYFKCISDSTKERAVDWK